MAGKRSAREATPSAAATAANTNAAAAAPQKPKQGAGWDKIAGGIASYYDEQTPQRTKLVDAFLVFLAAAGALQFLYCVLAGNFVRLPGGKGVVLVGRVC